MSEVRNQWDLTDSWNVIDSQKSKEDSSEASDAESIEVIQEIGQNSTPNESSSLRSSENSGGRSASSSNPEESIQLPEIPSSSSCSEIESGGKNEEGISRYSNPRHCSPLFYLSLIVGSFAILLGLIANGSYVSSSVQQNDDSSVERLLEQLKLHKEESQNLKGIVADLAEDVKNLKNELTKKELDSQVSTDRNEELLLLTGSESREIPEDYLSLIKFIEENLNFFSKPDVNLAEQSERLLYKVPKQLFFLQGKITSDETLTQFIKHWETTLSSSNKNLLQKIKDRNSETLTMIVKHLKKIEKSFYKELCSLKYFKKTDCLMKISESNFIDFDREGNVSEDRIDLGGKGPSKKLKKEGMMNENDDMNPEEGGSFEMNTSSSFNSENKSEKGQKARKRRKTREGSWYLRLGRQRSSLRYAASRADWLFERARHRRYRNRLFNYFPYLKIYEDQKDF